jgi:TrmH family RNA methyltransferase
MVSKNQIKLITSLQHKKYRQEQQLFLAEGVKVIQELLESNFELEHLFETKYLFNQVATDKKTLVNEQDMKRISALTTPSSCLAMFKMPKAKPIEERGLIIALDAVRDPGNLGTIIRLCDWFGVTQLLCSLETVDLFNTKVVQATMGSISRVNVSYVVLDDFLATTLLPVFGTFMDGANVYEQALPKDGILVLGNEANGISSQIEERITKKLAIPRFGAVQKTESLNVATAAAIFLSEFRRNA